MPRIKRWFPVSQDFNADPELWELTDKFGDRALRVWFEILSIADRNDGELPGPWSDYPSILAGRCKSTARHLRAVCEWVARWLVINSQGVARVRNYAKYHKVRGTNQIPSEPSDPSEPIIKKNNAPKAAEQIKEFLEPWPDSDAWLLNLVREQWFLKHCNGELEDHGWWSDVDRGLGGHIDPAFMVSEFSRMSAWFKENPARMKTAKGMRRFLRQWFERSINRKPAARR